MRYSLVACNKLSPNQRKTRMHQINDLITDLIVCTDCAKLLEYESKDIFLLAEKTSIQIKVKANHEYEKLSLDDLVDIAEQ